MALRSLIGCGLVAGLLASMQVPACGASDSSKALTDDGGAAAAGDGPGGAPTLGNGTAGNGGETSSPTGGVPNVSELAGASNAGNANGLGGAAQGGEVGLAGAANLPTCEADAGSPHVALNGFRADLFAEGGSLVQPNAMVFGTDGKLYVANSHSLISGVGDQGEILAIDSTGAQSTYFTDNLLRGPDGLAFGTPAVAGELGALFVSVEDGDESGVHANDYLLRATNGTPSIITELVEPAYILRGPGSEFDADFYFTARSTLSLNVPNELRLFQVTAAGIAQVFTITDANDDAVEILGAASVTWGNGGTLGQDMYLSTVVDQPYTPVSKDALFRVDADGAATELVSPYLAGIIGASPSPTGQFGDYVYATRGGALERIDSTGTVVTVIDGMDRPLGLTFGPDETLYVSDAAAAKIWKVRACAE